MRRTLVLAAAVTCAALIAAGRALAEDPPASPSLPRPVGTLLLDALPTQADLVVATPDLPGLFEAAAKAGLGDAASWRAAFDAQLRVWGAGAPESEKLVSGAGALLAAADGEVVVASIPLRLPGTDRPETRATVFALRSSRDEKTLRAAFRELLDGGLRLRYEGTPHEEQIGGRAVVALPGNAGTLYVSIQDGLLVAGDHPLALGLFFRGLAREDKPAGSAPARPPAAQLKLLVRHGRGNAAWEGWMWGEAETVTWKEATVRSTHDAGAELPAADSVLVIGADKIEDLPLFPVPVAPPGGDARDAAAGMTYLRFDGRTARPGVGRGESAGGPGGAWPLAWLAAMADGRTETPLPGIDAGLLAGPLRAAKAAAGDAAARFLAWKSSEAGQLSGPLGNGPATFVALRTLRDIARGAAPGDTPTGAAPTRSRRTDAPLPAPTEPR